MNFLQLGNKWVYTVVRAVFTRDTRPVLNSTHMAVYMDTLTYKNFH